MSARIDPKSLTAEERAIVDMEVAHLRTLPFPPKGDLYSYAFDCRYDDLVARRALFCEPASECYIPKSWRCERCQKPLGANESHRHGNLTGDGEWWSCQPASEGGKVCQNCKCEDTGHAWKVNGELRYLCAGWNKPAQPEPGAAEMERPECPPNKIVPSGAAPVTKPAPAVTMTEALEKVLDVAKWEAHSIRSIAGGDYPNSPQSARSRAEADEIDSAIAAVRSQAAEAGVKLPKVRELLDWFDADCRPYKSAKESSELRAAARTELIAAEGRK